jgi:tRNA dimethylallyltransferase
MTNFVIRPLPTKLTRMAQRIVLILGPTAGGKSDLAVALAQRFNGEILGADSMQIYKGLDAGTAKPTAEQRAAAVHHLIDVVETTGRYSVADWLGAAERTIAELHGRGRLPIVVGGTNLYVKALLEGLFDGPPADEAWRVSLAGVASQELHERLRKVDPATAERLHPNDRKRVLRALEVFQATGKGISGQQTQWSELGTGNSERGTEEGEKGSPHPNPLPGEEGAGGRAYRHDPIIIGLRWEVEAINKRINARVRGMFEPGDGGEGLIEETRRLETAGRLGPQAREALGTKQVLEHLAGRLAAEEALERVKIETRRFAKNQRTWLKRFRGVHWLEGSGPGVVEEAARVVEERLKPETRSPKPE